MNLSAIDIIGARHRPVSIQLGNTNEAARIHHAHRRHGDFVAAPGAHSKGDGMTRIDAAVFLGLRRWWIPSILAVGCWRPRQPQ
jgi:hypothetical protein